VRRRRGEGAGGFFFLAARTDDRPPYNGLRNGKSISAFFTHFPFVRLSVSLFFMSYRDTAMYKIIRHLCFY